MNEQQLFDAWKKSDELHQANFDETRLEIEKLAKQKSNDVFLKIRKTMNVEIAVTIVICAVFPFIFSNNEFYFMLIWILLIASLVIAFFIYGKYLRDMKNLNESSILVSLEKKIGILSRYIKQLKIFNYGLPHFLKL